MQDFKLPLTDPVLIFTIELLIILLIPPLVKRAKIPGIVGLILAGMIIGPNGFSVLLRNSSIILLGTIGLLYIMFLAGLELDMHDFKRNRLKSLLFGAITFLIPLGLGWLICYHVLYLPVTGSLMLASMFATHTLVSFPIASRFGLSRNEAVIIAVGGTIITDTAVLLVLAFVSLSQAEGGIHSADVLALLIKFTAFSLAVMLGFPRIGRWFFKSVESEGGAQYLFVLSMVFLAAFLADLAGVEPIIGAFLAGLALNPLIPHTGLLMNRIEFIGNTIFIPFFLLSVGMLVDVKILFTGGGAITIAALLTLTAIGSKWLSAFITALLLKLSKLQRRLLFGLTSSHAAATLAVVLVGYDMGLFSTDILNASVLIILFTCLVSSFVTEAASLKLAEAEPLPVHTEIWERILIPIANPQSIPFLMNFALRLRDPESKEPLFPLLVVSDDVNTEKRIRQHEGLVKKIMHDISPGTDLVQHVSRVNLNISSGISMAIKELLISDIVLGWSTQQRTRELLFGTVIDSIVAQTNRTVWVTRFLYPLNTTTRIIVAVPGNARKEIGFTKWLKKIIQLARHVSAELAFASNDKNWQAISTYFEENQVNIPSKQIPFPAWNNFPSLTREVGEDDLFVAISARPATLSYQKGMEHISRQLKRYFSNRGFMIIYPEQLSSGTDRNSIEI
jgi:Kef-type K+ transport system membrane component KefB